MGILVLIAFLAGVVFYLSTNKVGQMSVGAYIIGLFLGVLAMIILSFISFENMIISTGFWTHTFRFFLNYVLIPTVIGLPIFLLISFSLSEETLLSVPASLLGVYTVVFVMTAFSLRLIPDVKPLLLLLLIYFGIIFLLDFLLNIMFSALSIIATGISFVIAFFVFLVVSFFAFTAFAGWYFSQPAIQYFSIALTLAVLGTALYVIVSKITK